MKKKRLIPVVTLFTMLWSVFPAGTGSAAPSEASLTVHYFKSSQDYRSQIEAFPFEGHTPAELRQVTYDSFGQTTVFAFDNQEPDAYLGFTVAEDSVFNTDKRYVRAVDGAAEAWVIDGNPGVFREPVRLDPSIVVKKDLKAYVAVEDLTDVLGLTYSYGQNGYVFDGAARNTVDILTIYHDRDYFEINVNTNRIGSNVTSSMLSAYNDIVFNDVDGYRADSKYYLSLGYLERLFQIGSLVIGSDVYLLEKQYAAYDQLQYAAPETLGFSSERLEALDSYINREIANGFTGLTLTVVKDGKVMKESAYGYAKKYGTSEADGVIQPAVPLPENEWTPATVNTLYDLASNSKMYATNYAIQKLVSEGKLDLDRTLQSFPGWENFRDDYTVYSGKFVVGGTGGITAIRTGKETVTIRDILHHYGGLIPDPEYPNQLSAGELWYQTDDYTDRSGIIDIISKTPLQYTPKTTFAYSDVDYMILGLLVEQITGVPLDQYVEENIYAEMGLTHTMFRPLDKGFSPSDIAATELNGNTRDGNVSFGDDINIRKYTLQGEVHDEKAYYSMAGVAGHAGLFSNVGDMGALTQLMLNGGIYNGKQFFTKEVADEFVTPYHVNPANVNSSTIGLGWRVHSKSASAYYYFNWGPSRSTYGHQGWTGTMTIIDPVYNMSIVILANYRHSPVVSPPNGFAAASNQLADFVPISGRIYNALLWDKEQYSPIRSVSPVDDIAVAHGTSLEDAIGALPASATVTDSNGKLYTAPLAWSIEGYDGETAGEYEAAASLELPNGVIQSDPPIALSVSATVTVLEEPNIIHSITPVAELYEVGNGTSEENAVGALPASTVVTDNKDQTYNVALAWTIAGYNGAVAGDYAATAVFELPVGVIQSEPPLPLSLTTTVRVKAPVSSGGGGGYIPPQPPKDETLIYWNGSLLSEAGESKLVTTDGVSTLTVELNAAKVTEQLGSNSGEMALSVRSSAEADVFKVVLDGGLLRQLQDRSVQLEIASEHGIYSVPALDIQELRRKFAGNPVPANIKLTVSIQSVGQSLADALANALAAKDIQLAAPPVDFGITASVGAQTAEIGSFGRYAARWIPVPEGASSNGIATAVRIGEDHEIYPVPSQRVQKDDRSYVQINSLTNSLYGLIAYEADVPAISGHWSKEAVSDLANRLIIDQAETFTPDAAITRADFAEYIARALGIYTNNPDNSGTAGTFADVSSQHPSRNAILVASGYGIVNGYPDGTFRPNNTISREEAMVMYARAMRIADLEGENPDRIKAYLDAGQVSEWAYPDVLAVVSANVFNGRSATRLDPKGTFSYAEAATAVRNLLIEAGLIDG